MKDIRKLYNYLLGVTTALPFGGTMKHTVEIEAVDIPTMYKMSDAEYEQYVKNELLFVDHHDVLRSKIAQYPLAVTKRQLQIPISHLQILESQVGAESE